MTPISAVLSTPKGYRKRITLIPALNELVTGLHIKIERWLDTPQYLELTIEDARALNDQLTKLINSQEPTCSKSKT